MTKNKRGSAWIWIIIILILIAVGAGIYFWLSGGDASTVVDAGQNLQPPALPSG